MTPRPPSFPNSRRLSFWPETSSRRDVSHSRRPREGDDARKVFVHILRMALPDGGVRRCAPTTGRRGSGNQAADERPVGKCGKSGVDVSIYLAKARMTGLEPATSGVKGRCVVGISEALT